MANWSPKTASQSSTEVLQLPPAEPMTKPPTEGLMQRWASDVSSNGSQIQKELKLGIINEVERAECECCGMIEEYTVGYVEKVRDFHQGNWICGICSADVKEHLAKFPMGAMEEAMSSHMAECRKFNGTTRINPKLSLAAAMRDIARRCRDGGRSSQRKQDCPNQQLHAATRHRERDEGPS